MKPGIETSEYKQTQRANVLTVVGVAAGATVAVLGEFSPVGGTAGQICGAIVAVASILYNTLTTLGYTSARTKLKATEHLRAIAETRRERKGENVDH